jgi:hypothetical protein
MTIRFVSEQLYEQCNKDIKKFIKLNKLDATMYQKYSLYIPVGNETQEQLRKQLEELIMIFDKHIPTNSDYVHTISKCDENTQQILWIARTYLLYQLFIYACAMCTHKKLYDTICIPYYKNDAQYSLSTKSIFLFRSNLIRLLDCIGLSNFGSMNATSDIDIGIDYYCNKNKIPSNEPPLTYIIACMDAMFFIFTNKSSLAYDIEIYGNLLTLRNNDKYSKSSIHQDYFYLDTSQFGYEDFKHVLQPIITGMLRNVILGYIDVGITTESHIKRKLVTDFGKNTSLYSLLTYATTILTKYNVNIDEYVIKDSTLIDICSDTTMFNDALKDALLYLLLDRTNRKKASLLYYTSFYHAEKKQMKILKNVDYNIDLITTKDIVSIISSWSTSSIYKMENYVSSSTIMHVVRLLQEQKNKLHKYDSVTPGQYCKRKIRQLEPYCIIGHYGYIISLLEQIGYLIRFNNVYCIKGTDTYYKAKCEKKIGKYMKRIIDALKRLDDIKKNNVSIRDKTHKHIVLTKIKPLRRTQRKKHGKK